jgi:hypothetical protein
VGSQDRVWGFSGDSGESEAVSLVVEEYLGRHYQDIQFMHYLYCPSRLKYAHYTPTLLKASTIASPLLYAFLHISGGDLLLAVPSA